MVTRQCACGCGGMTKGGVYRPGHDSKHASALLKAGRHAELKKRGWSGSPIPEWAQELANKVCKDYGRRPPRIKWTSHDGRWTSGVTSFGNGDTSKHIRIRAGVLDSYTRIVLLHELAHYLSPRRAHHTKAFWLKAWSLYENYDADLFMACVTEFSYRRKSWEYCPSAIRQWYGQKAEEYRITGQESGLGILAVHLKGQIDVEDLVGSYDHEAE
jgi:hypothetical protein